MYKKAFERADVLLRDGKANLVPWSYYMKYMVPARGRT